MIECINTGLVYRNPAPHLRAVHAWHPSLARLDNGELLAAFDLGQGAESLDYRTYLSRSRDNGQTWETPVRLFEDSVERRTTHSIRISRTFGGDLVGFGSRFYRDDPSVGLVNHTNLGYVPMDLLFLRSVDDGGKVRRHWQVVDGERRIHPAIVMKRRLQTKGGSVRSVSSGRPTARPGDPLLFFRASG